MILPMCRSRPSNCDTVPTAYIYSSASGRHPARAQGSVRRRRRQRLNAGLFIVRDRHHPQLPHRLALQVLIDDLTLLVDVHCRHYFGLKGGMPRFHVVANLVRPKFALPQNLVEFGSAQLAQRRVSGATMLAHMGRQQLKGLKFIRIFPTPSAFSRHSSHPGNRIVRQLPWLARSRQFRQRRVQPNARHFWMQRPNVLRLTLCATQSSGRSGRRENPTGTPPADCRRFSSARNFRMGSNLRSSPSLNCKGMRFFEKCMPLLNVLIFRKH